MTSSRSPSDATRPHARPLAAVAAVVVLGAVMSILDTTIVNVAIDSLARHFETSIAATQWVATAYLLALAFVIPLTGWATDRFGARRVWMVSVLLFVAGSALAGVSWSLGSLVAFRVVQGLGGGMVMPAGQTILAHVAGPQRMGRVMSIVGVPMLLGPVLGPAIGGVVVQQLGWRWIFYVNLPLGLATLVLARRLLPELAGRRDHPPDALGLALLCPGLTLVVYGLADAGAHGGATRAATIVPIVSGALLSASFVGHASRRGARALIDVGLFRLRSFAAATASLFLFGVSTYGILLLLPLYYQSVRHEDALTAGLLMAPQGLGAALAMPLVGVLVDRVGAGRLVAGGVAVAVAATAVYAELTPHTSYGVLAGALALRGVGLAAIITPATAAAYERLTRGAVARATAAIYTIQRLGGAFGTTVMAVVLERSVRHHAGGRTLSAIQQLPRRERLPLTEHLTPAFAHTFGILCATMAFAIVPALLLPLRASRTSPPEDVGERALQSG